jgi:hypothetical protein
MGGANDSEDLMLLAALKLAVLATAGGSVVSATSGSPAAFSGYSQPEVTADNCTSKGAGQLECLIPGKTAGRYLIVARGSATSTGADSVEGIAIGGAGWNCGRIVSQKGAWTGSRTFAASCVVTILSDEPVRVAIAFGGAQVQVDPKSPTVTFRRLPWNGVLGAGGLQGGILAPAKAGGAEKKKP